MTVLTASSLVGSLHSLRDKAQGTNLSKAPLISQAHGRNRKSDTHMVRHSPFVLLTIQVQINSIYLYNSPPTRAVQNILWTRSDLELLDSIWLLTTSQLCCPAWSLSQIGGFGSSRAVEVIVQLQNRNPNPWCTIVGQTTNQTNSSRNNRGNQLQKNVEW